MTATATAVCPQYSLCVRVIGLLLFRYSKFLAGESILLLKIYLHSVKISILHDYYFSSFDKKKIRFLYPINVGTYFFNFFFFPFMFVDFSGFYSSIWKTVKK